MSSVSTCSGSPCASVQLLRELSSLFFRACSSLPKGNLSLSFFLQFILDTNLFSDAKSSQNHIQSYLIYVLLKSKSHSKS